MEKIDQVQKFSGRMLREARKTLKLTQAEFAEPLSISGGYVSKLEKDEKKPSEAVLRELVQQYGLSRKALETGEGELFAYDPGVAYGSENLCTDQKKVLQIVEKSDEILEFVLSLEETDELKLLIKDLHGRTPDEVLDYVRAGRKALRGEKG